MLLQGMLWLAYPLIIFFGLQVLEPRYVALLLALTLLLRRRRDAGRLLAGLSRIDLAVLIALLALAGITALTNSEILLRLYPAAVNLGMLLLFGLSLKYPPTMIERFARLSEPDLPSAGVRYTRRVTLVWCAFFIANGGVAIYTALQSSRDVWALYNGFIAYLLMGALFAGEWLIRRHYLSAARHDNA
jgi:uncharacterized membrane protein